MNMPEPGLIIVFIAIGYIVYLIEELVASSEEEDDDDFYFN